MEICTFEALWHFGLCIPSRKKHCAFDCCLSGQFTWLHNNLISINLKKKACEVMSLTSLLSFFLYQSNITGTNQLRWFNKEIKKVSSDVRYLASVSFFFFFFLSSLQVGGVGQCLTPLTMLPFLTYARLRPIGAWCASQAGSINRITTE